MIPPFGRQHMPLRGLVESFPFAFGALPRLGLALVNVRPSTSRTVVDSDRDLLDVRFGPWRVVTPLLNIGSVELAGPYSAWKVFGARMSLADFGLTFGTNTVAGVCIQFLRPVRGIEPTGLLRHPSLTVTVAEPERLLARLAPFSSAGPQRRRHRATT
jgi:hypothetical protein